MNKKIIVLGLCTLMVCGCGKTIPTLSNGDEAVVTFSNGDKISANELYNNIKTDYALSTLIDMVDKKILEDKYKDKLDNAKEYANATMKSLEASFGDDLDASIQQYTGLSGADAYKEYVYIGYLRDMAIEDYAKNQLKEKEIKDYYEKNIYGDVLVNHILVTAKTDKDASEEDKNKAKDEAKEKVNTIIAKLKESKDVKATFTELAKEYSEDESTKNDGGSLGYINNGTLSSDYDEILKNAFQLKNGEFSTEVITTELGYHVIFRENNKEKASLDDVRDSIKETLADKMLSDDSTLSTKAMQQTRKDYGLDIIDSDIQSQYSKYIQAGLTPSKE